MTEYEENLLADFKAEVAKKNTVEQYKKDHPAKAGLVILGEKVKGLFTSLVILAAIIVIGALALYAFFFLLRHSEGPTAWDIVKGAY